MAEQKFCVTCKHYCRRSPVGKSNSGDCTLNPSWQMLKSPTTHWCSYHSVGLQRGFGEMYQPAPINLTPEVTTEVAPEVEDRKMKRTKVGA